MPRPDAIQAEGLVVELLPDGVCRVELANGHRLVARASGRWRPSLKRLGLGDRVAVEVSPYDLSKGRIVLRESN